MGADVETHMQTLGRALVTPRKRGRKDCMSQRGSGHEENTAHRINWAGFTGAHRVGSANHGVCMGLLGPLHTCCGCLALDFCGTRDSGSRGVSDSFACHWDPFSPTGLLFPALIGGIVPNLIASWSAMFRWYCWEACPFLRGVGGAVGLGERGSGGV